MAEDESVDGPKIAAEILNRMPSDARERILGSMRQQAPKVVEQVEDKMFRFDQILEVTAQGLQVLLQSITQSDLVLSLKTAAPEVKAVLLSNMTERRRNQILDELGSLPPVRLRDVEDAQRRILQRLEELRTAGSVKTQGDGGFYV